MLFRSIDAPPRRGRDGETNRRDDVRALTLGQVRNADDLPTLATKNRPPVEGASGGESSPLL